MNEASAHNTEQRDQFAPGSYIFSTLETVLDIAGKILDTPLERLPFHPDLSHIKSTGSISIDTIRSVSHFLRITPAIAPFKIVVIENFHTATIEAQNAFLKTFEEPPEHAYIFLVTPYVDRLLKTIVSRAQVITTNPKGKTQNPKPQSKTLNLSELIAMDVGERIVWLENEIKGLDQKGKIKIKLIELLDALLPEALTLAQAHKINVNAIEYAKEARWKIEQGFPNPRLLIEGFLIYLGA